MGESTAVPAAPGYPRLRIWPAIVIVALMWAAIKGPRWLQLDDPRILFMGMFMGPMVCGGLFLIWWLFFSRAPNPDRWVTFLVSLAIGGAAYAAYEKSVGGMMIVLNALPIALTVWTGWLLVTPRLHWSSRSIGLAALLIGAFGYFTLLRMDGVDGDFNADLAFRWQPTNEKLFMAERSGTATQSLASDAAPALTLSPGDWPGFRGPNRDSRLTGVRIATDWDKNPPKELWRRRVGPGWSSVTVIGNRLFTQEQRNTDEVVVCYNADTGAELWAHADKARFEEPVAGAGPRATPTFFDGKLYTLGAAGKLNCLDAASGKVVWSHDIISETESENLPWGLAASPLVHNGIVTASPGKSAGKAVVGYRADNGQPAWTGADSQHSYSSTQLARLQGVDQLLFASDKGLTSLDPSTGKVLWHDDWDTRGEIARILQPAVVSDSDVLFSTAFDKGTRRIRISRNGDQWKTENVWEMLAFKPYYNDFVVHNGHLYGFNGQFFTCIGLDDHTVKWKVRGYGSGQVLLLADQGLLLVASEKGEVALVEAKPEKHEEVARFPALQGKTWNHPVIAHGKLFVRNGAEMACFALKSAP